MSVPCLVVTNVSVSSGFLHRSYLLCHPHGGCVSFLPYAMAGNKNELHENKEEFALQKCFITQSVSVCIFFWGWSDADMAKSKGSAVQQESCGLFLSEAKEKGIPSTPWAKVMNDTKCFSYGCEIKCEMEVGCSWPGDRIPSSPSEEYGKAKGIGLPCESVIYQREICHLAKKSE